MNTLVDHVQVYDNFLDENYFKCLQDYFLGADCPWYYNRFVVAEDEVGTVKNELNSFQFTHCFYDYDEPRSRDWEIVKPLRSILTMESLIRMKANLIPRLDTVEEHGHHVDFKFPCNTAVLYLNTCNGYTKFEESGEKVYSVENRLVVFPSHLRHTGSSCTDQKVRVVLNLNWI